MPVVALCLRAPGLPADARGRIIIARMEAPASSPYDAHTHTYTDDKHKRLSFAKVRPPQHTTTNVRSVKERDHISKYSMTSQGSADH